MRKPNQQILISVLEMVHTVNNLIQHARYGMTKMLKGETKSISMSKTNPRFFVKTVNVLHHISL